MAGIRRVSPWMNFTLIGAWRPATETPRAFRSQGDDWLDASGNAAAWAAVVREVSTLEVCTPALVRRPMDPIRGAPAERDLSACSVVGTRDSKRCAGLHPIKSAERRRHRSSAGALRHACQAYFTALRLRRSALPRGNGLSSHFGVCYDRRRSQSGRNPVMTQAHFVQECPTCARPLQIKVEYLGRHLTCPHCRGKIEARDPEDAAVSRGMALLRRADELLGQSKIA